MQKFRRRGVSMYRALWRRRRLIMVLGLAGSLGLVLIIFGSWAIIKPNSKYVINSNSDKHVKVGLVLGAGITDEGKPFKELQARLDVAAEALGKGLVDKLILSGDNRFKNYDEPTAMLEYLTKTRGVSVDKLQPDFAGRSTYESCDRASRIFGIHQTIIFSAGSHLPRAIYLCRQLGVEAYGISSGVEANNSTRRELMANVKALYNVYLNGENTVLGERIEF